MRFRRERVMTIHVDIRRILTDNRAKLCPFAGIQATSEPVCGEVEAGGVGGSIGDGRFN